MSDNQGKATAPSPWKIQKDRKLIHLDVRGGYSIRCFVLWPSRLKGARAGIASPNVCIKEQTLKIVFLLGKSIGREDEECYPLERGPQEDFRQQMRSFLDEALNRSRYEWYDDPSGRRYTKDGTGAEAAHA